MAPLTPEETSFLTLLTLDASARLSPHAKAVALALLGGTADPETQAAAQAFRTWVGCLPFVAPKQRLRVLLVRHGQSAANLDSTLTKTVADHAIPLTPEGRRQAQEAGKFLAGWLEENPGRVRLWRGPYLRTRQTAGEILDTCVSPSGSEPLIQDAREHLLLHEQQFGIFDGLTDDERARRFPDEMAYYEKSKASLGKAWPQMPLGESRVQVCTRVHQAFGTFHRDHDRHGIDTIVVVGHGTTNRAFVTMWCHHPFEWMSSEPNPANCSIRLLQGSTDMGYIFPGF